MRCLNLSKTSRGYRLLLSQRLLYYAYGCLILAFLLVAICSVLLIYIHNTGNFDYFMYAIVGLLTWNTLQVFILVHIAKRIRQYIPPEKNIKFSDVELNA